MLNVKVCWISFVNSHDKNIQDSFVLSLNNTGSKRMKSKNHKNNNYVISEMQSMTYGVS